MRSGVEETLFVAVHSKVTLDPAFFLSTGGPAMLILAESVLTKNWKCLGYQKYVIRIPNLKSQEMDAIMYREWLCYLNSKAIVRSVSDKLPRQNIWKCPISFVNCALVFSTY